MLAKVKITVDSPIELTVDIPKDKLNREDIITYLKGVMSQVVIGKSKLEFEVIDDVASFKIPKVASAGVFDADKVQFPLLLRPWRKGDWFIPFGMEGRKKVSDFLIDQKIPIHRKSSVFVLESDGNIVWVVSHRIDNRYRVNSESAKVLHVKIRG